MKGAFRHQNIIIFLDPILSLAHKTNSARKATIKNLNTFAENIVTFINSEEAKKGDLIFFKTSRRNRINHVGMIVDTADGDIKFIHASVSEGVIISSVKEKYYSKKVTQFNRVL